MAYKPPIIRQVNWLAVAGHICLYAIAVVAASLIAGRDSNPVLLGCGALLAYSVVARFGIARAHRRGIGRMKANEWDAAIPEFETSYRFFSNHPWLDRFRAVALMSASAISYREMALANIAFAHSQAGRGSDARCAYERTLNEFPQSSLATAALNLIRAAESSASGSGAG